MRAAVDRAREESDEVVDLVHGQNERVRLLRDGRPPAALISADHLELVTQLEADSRR